MKNIDFSNRTHVGHLTKGSCLGNSYTKLAPCLVWCRYIFCRLRMYFIRHVIPQNHFVDMSCIFMGESTSQHVQWEEKCLIENLDLINMYCHWKIELTGQQLGEKKMSQPQKCTFLEEVPKNLKIYFPLTTFYDFVLKIEISWVKIGVKPSLETGNINDVIVYVWYIYFQIKKI